jgi:hypothetical protein
MKKEMSNIKSKKFYQEAEDMEPGWGKYLRWIDVLKDKVDNQDNITLKEACWVLYGEGYNSSYWEMFYKHCTNKKWSKRKMPWDAWKGIHQTFFKIYEQQT